MQKIILFLICVIITGCAHTTIVPVTTMPTPPTLLMQSPVALHPMTLSDTLCKILVDAKKTPNDSTLCKNGLKTPK